MFELVLFTQKGQHYDKSKGHTDTGVKIQNRSMSGDVIIIQLILYPHAGLSLVKTIHMERINSRVVTSNVKSFEFTLAQKR